MIAMAELIVRVAAILLALLFGARRERGTGHDRKAGTATTTRKALNRLKRALRARRSVGRDDLDADGMPVDRFRRKRGE